jgi:hypothetical protein
MLKSKFIPAAVAVLILILAIILNPSPEQHRAKITEKIAERSQLEKVLGVGQLTAFVSKYQSLGVASYTTAGGKVASIGVMGMVFVLE